MLRAPWVSGFEVRILLIQACGAWGDTYTYVYIHIHTHIYLFMYFSICLFFYLFYVLSIEHAFLDRRKLASAMISKL